MENIQLDVDDQGTALLTLNRPDVLNVLNAALIEEVSAVLGELAADERVRALVLTGSGRGFCAGADLGSIGQGGASGESIGEMVASLMQSHFNPMMEHLYHFPRPVVCAVNGIAAGGGAALALCGDIVLASQDAGLKFVQVQQLGIVADLGANWLLPRIAGRARALGACLLGDTLKAAQLQEWGLVWECLEPTDLLPRAKEIALRLGQVPSETVVATRTLVDAATQQPFPAVLERERLAQGELCDLPVFSESVARFFSK
ncbi:MAG: enoyl-CoA hydratase [Haliea sp.]|nr:enoyl-CoA hydratase [Haliea sp.]